MTSQQSNLPVLDQAAQLYYYYYTDVKTFSESNIFHSASYSSDTRICALRVSG